MYRVYIVERRTWQLGLAVLALAVLALAARWMPGLLPAGQPGEGTGRSWPVAGAPALGPASSADPGIPAAPGASGAADPEARPAAREAASPAGAAPARPEAGAERPAASSKPAGQEAAPQPAGRDLYESYRLERERQRSRQVELLRQLIDDPAAQPAQRQAHQEQLLHLWRMAEKETQAEQVLKARGYPDALVILSDSGANVVVPVVLNREEAARIGEAVARVAGISQEQVVIVDAATPRR